MMQEKLMKFKAPLPCPFCGGAADIYSSYENPDVYHVKCDQCHARSGWYHQTAEAVKAWNSRFSND